MPKTIEIKGVIVSDDEKWIYDWFGIANTSPSDVTSALLDAAGDDVEVIINSGGGSVFAGSEIYTALKDYKGQVLVKIVGVAASAASVIAMAGDLVAISPTAQIMIHNVWSIAVGDYRDMQQESDVLKNFNTSIANAYRLKTGLSEQELKDMMDKETWLNAQQALEKGFVDEIMFDEQKQLAASLGPSGLLPQEVIAKMRAFLKKEQDAKAGQSVDQEKQKRLYAARLNLLKLKGVGENG